MERFPRTEWKNNLDARCAPAVPSRAQFEKELTRERRARLRAPTSAHTPARESPIRAN